MRFIVVSVVCPVILACAFWAVFGACVDAEVEATPPLSRVLVAWGPLACGDPHRVIIELDAIDDGARVVRSVPCAIGWMALDVPHVGDYRARVDSAPDGDGSDATLVDEIELDIETQIVRWTLEAPP